MKHAGQTNSTIRRAAIVSAAVLAGFLAAGAQQARDPAAWGSNHVGKPVPEYVHGDECLFCHRNDIGPAWEPNSHARTVRTRQDAPELEARLKKLLSQSATPAAAAQVGQAEYFLGSRRRVRLLRQHGYGQFGILKARIELSASGAEWAAGTPAWDNETFGTRCAGCHATGVDSKARTYSAFGIDCYGCHGDVNLEHTNDTSLIWLSKKRRRDVQAITSICAQCHLRGGRARSTGLPYPNNFVAGDNLFQDYDARFERLNDEGLSPGDRHVLRNVREVVVEGTEQVTCLNCHRVHAPAGTPSRHRFVAKGPICFDCHVEGGPWKTVKPMDPASATCDY